MLQDTGLRICHNLQTKIQDQFRRYLHGVLGTTGIETQEILKGIVENVRPKLIIVIDALASKSMERISSTIQIADTGIVPGAGVR